MESISVKRTSKLIVNFKNGFAEGWFMAVKECFKPQLDIKLTERKRNRVVYEEWTQGPYFCFSEGQIFFDAEQGYGEWGNGLNYVHIACQVIDSKPNLPSKKINSVTGETKLVVVDGFVRFILYFPNEERTQLIGKIGYQLTQNQFVDFLRTGEI